MRFTGIRLPLLAAVACASVGLSLSATDRSYGQAIYVYPTSRTYSCRRSYLLPRSYVVPSSYVFPSYIESSYTVEPAVSLLPTGYIETTYRRGLFGRRWVVERPVVAATRRVVPSRQPTYQPTCRRRMSSPTYYSTSYRVGRYRPTTYTYYPTTYYPTVYETAYTSSGRHLLRRESLLIHRSGRAPQGSAVSSAPSRGSREVESRSLEDPTSYPSYVDPPLPGENTKARSTVRSDEANRPRDSPPSPPAAAAATTPTTKAATKGAAERCGDPEERTRAEIGRSGNAENQRQPPPPRRLMTQNRSTFDPRPASDEPVRRDSLKAIYPRVRTVDRRNVLFGSVETDDGQTSRRSAGERRQP